MKNSTLSLPCLLALALVTSCSHPSSRLDDVTVFRNVTLVPMTSEITMPGQAVITANGRIIRIDHDHRILIPKGARIIDGKGKYLMPGLADMHTHVGENLKKSYLNLFVRYGVTTIRDLPQGSPPSLLSLAGEVKRGSRLGPQILVANHIMGNETDPSKLVVASAEAGYQGIKLNSYFTRQKFLDAMEMARQQDIYALGHLSFLLDFETILNSGFRESSHVLELVWFLSDFDRSVASTPQEAEEWILTDLLNQINPFVSLPESDFEDTFQPRIRHIINQIGDRDFAITTTLVCNHDIMLKMLRPDSIKNAPYARLIPDLFWDNISSGLDKHYRLFPDHRVAALIHRLDCLLFKELSRQKKFMVLGTDVGPGYLSIIPGYSVHQELKLFVENGLTPFEALTLATRNASVIAGRMGNPDDFGTIEKDRRADLILLDANPLADISNTLKIAGVMANGIFYPTGLLDSIANIDKGSLRGQLMETYHRIGIDGAISLYRSLKTDNFFNRYFYNENTLVLSGYDMLKQDAPNDALLVFRENAIDYPASANAWDCLGEVYLKLGNREEAIINYRKALSINPLFENSARILDSLEIR